MDKKLQVLIYTRWLAILVHSSIGGWLIVSLFGSFLVGPFIIALATLILSNLIAHLFLWKRKCLRLVTYATLIVDIIVETWTIYWTNGIQSPCYLLYCGTVIVTSIVLSLQASVIMAILASVFYGVLIFGGYKEVFPIPYLFDAPQVTGFSIWGLFLYRLLFLYLIAGISGYLMRVIEQRNRKIEELHKELLNQEKARSARLEERIRLSERLADVGMIATKFGHEVGNSLVGIRLFTENLSEELNSDDPKQQYTRKILSEVNNLTNKITQLKDFAKPVSLDIITTDINKLLENTLEVVEAGKNSKIKVETKLAPDLPEIELDYNQMKGAFLNITLNAIQSMPKGGILKVDTSLLSSDDEEASYIKVRITDTGSGIPKNIQDKIFLPFFTTKNGIGTGLGLAIVHKIITSHEGEIYFESGGEGRGTTFTVILPLKIKNLQGGLPIE